MAHSLQEHHGLRLVSGDQAIHVQPILSLGSIRFTGRFHLERQFLRL